MLLFVFQSPSRVFVICTNWSGQYEVERPSEGEVRMILEKTEKKMQRQRLEIRRAVQSVPQQPGV